MKTCRLCGLDVPNLVRSHVIPRSILYLRENLGDPLGIVGRSSVSRSPSGIYDRFLCHSCEGKFAGLDRAAVELIRGLDAGEPLHASDGELMAWMYSEALADATILRRFAHSLLLRAHLASHEFFASVDLGPHYPRLAKLVQSGHPGSTLDFTVVAWRTDHVLTGTAWQPKRCRAHGCSGYWFGLERLHLFVKVDSRPLDRQHAVLALGSQPLVHLFRRELSDEQEQGIASMLDSQRDRLDRLLGKTNRELPR